MPPAFEITSTKEVYAYALLLRLFSEESHGATACSAASVGANVLSQIRHSRMSEVTRKTVRTCSVSLWFIEQRLPRWLAPAGSQRMPKLRTLGCPEILGAGEPLLSLPGSFRESV